MPYALDAVIAALEAGRQRATYGAVAQVTGRPAAFVMSGRPRDFANSFVVNRQTGMPTGYAAVEMHPELLARKHVIAAAEELTAWLINSSPPSSTAADDRLRENPWLHVSNQELLDSYAGIMDALRHRQVVRSHNNPVADIAEELGRRAFGLTLAPKSEKGFDAIAPDGTRWQVKGRRRTAENRSTQLGAIRDLAEKPFDVVLAVYFDEHFRVTAAFRISHECVSSHARYSKSLRGHRMILTEHLRCDARCEDVTARVREAADEFLSGRAPIHDVSSKEIAAPRPPTLAGPLRSQRDVMRELWRQLGGDPTAVCAAYADAERAGKVLRSHNRSGVSPEDYARRLLADGLKKGWLK